MAETIFYSTVDRPVQSALDSRKAYYSADKRDSNAHTWLHRKMAWADANAFIVKMSPDSKSIFEQLKTKNIDDLSVVTKAKLTSNIGGGFSKRTGGYSTGEGMYKNEMPNADVGRWRPKPHIEKITISANGDWGSTKMADLMFRVYSRSDLNDMIAFLTIGAYVEINYGWSTNSGAEGDVGKFRGIIYNFNYNVDENGGFGVTTKIIGPGISIFSTYLNGNFQSKNEATDSTSQKLLGTTIASALKLSIASVQDKKLLPGKVDESGIGMLHLPLTVPDKNDAANKEKYAHGIKVWYISLESVVKLVNTLFNNTIVKQYTQQSTLGDDMVALALGINATPAQPTPMLVAKTNLVDIKCNKEYTKIASLTSPELLVSANPMECIFPGYNTYTNTTFDSQFTFQDYEMDVRYGYGGRIMIATDWLIDFMTQLSSKDPRSTVSDLFKGIFEMIHSNSGDRWSLSIINDPKNEYIYYIADINYVDTEVTPYKITTVTKDSICRATSINGKIPAEYAAAAQIAGITALTADPRALSMLNSTISPAASENLIDPDVAKSNLSAAKYNIMFQAFDYANIEQLKSCLRAMYMSSKPGQNMNNIRIPFGLDFTVTMDGIDGFVFGNAITSNYLPDIYQVNNNKVAFTVTTVTHTIADNDWTTTLNTVCRVQL